MITEGTNAIDWGKYEVQPSANIKVPCTDIETQSNFAGSIDWAFGALEGSGSQYEAVSSWYNENTSPYPGETVYFGGPINGNCSELGNNRNFAIEYEPYQTYYMIVRYTYDCGGTCAQEEWHTVNTTGALEYAYVLIVTAFIMFAFSKLVEVVLEKKI